MSETNDTAELLADIKTFVERFVVLHSEAQGVALALWVAHTHAVDAAQATPYLYIASPEKRCGKSRLLRVLKAICAKGEHVSSISAAALYRTIEAFQPTLLLDEVDTTFNSNTEQGEALRGILNAGNERDAVAIRCAGAKMTEVQRYQVFGPKVLAGIDNGKLPDTIRDRCVVIRLSRKTTEPVERWLIQEVDEDVNRLQDWLEDWAGRNVDVLRGARPLLPAALDDRAQEGWWALLAIADLAGGDWPSLARTAAVDLAPGDLDEVSRGVQLLEDVRHAFQRETQEAVFTSSLVDTLNSLDESPWGAYHNGTGMRPRDLGRYLRPFHIMSRTVRVGDQTAKGYRREQFDDAWTRYLSEASQGSQTSHPRSHGNGDVTDVTDVTLPTGVGR
jgi:putative DNA primase/helicase